MDFVLGFVGRARWWVRQLIRVIPTVIMGIRPTSALVAVAGAEVLQGGP